MKILIISHEYPPIGGGGANACYYLAREFAGKGHSVTIITSNYQNLSEKVVENNITVIRVNSKRKYIDHCTFEEMFSYLMKAWPVAKKSECINKYDVCVTFFGIPGGLLNLGLTWKYRLPYIIRFGGGDIPGAQKRYKYIYKLIAPIIRKIWKNAGGLVANSEGLKQRAREFYDKKDIEIISNGVDTTFFCPKQQKKDSDEIQILFVSRLIEGKGLQFVLPELKQIQKQVEKKIHLTIVGDGPYRESLEKIVRDEQLENMVFFAGQKEKKEVIPFYQSSDIFILPSLSEGMPNVVLEAMACGLPVIMTPCGGSKELIHENGYITSIEEFGQTLCRLCKDEDLQEKMGQKSRQIVEQKFSWTEKADHYLKLLEKCMR